MKKFSFLKNFRHKLTNIGKKEPIHLFSLIIIIALDIFVLSNIFQGLNLQKAQLDSPSEVIPYACENYLPDESKNFSTATVRKNKVETITTAINKSSYFGSVSNKYASAIEIIEDKNKAVVHQDCRAIFAQSLVLNESETLQDTVEKIEKSEEKIYDFEQEIRELKDSYDTILLERIADQSDELSLTEDNSDTIKAKLATKERALENLKNEIVLLEDSLLENTESVKFLELSAAKKSNIEAAKDDLNFWYPLKKLAVQMMFLLPLFLFFLWQYKRVRNKENSLMSLVFSHLFLVTLIPIVLKLLELVFEIIPFHVFDDLIELLEALNLVAIWNYLLIAISIGAAIAVIYFLQKKVFSPQVTWKKRLAKKKCWNCGKAKISQTEKFCPFCSEAQIEICRQCGGNKFCKAEFCPDCGKK